MNQKFIVKVKPRCLWKLKKHLGIKDGETILYIQKGNDIIITTRRIQIERIQQIVKKSKVKYSVDDFIADRRQEAMKELEN